MSAERGSERSDMSEARGYGTDHNGE